MSARTTRQIFLILAASSLEAEDAPEDHEYIDEWVPEHVGHPENSGDDLCAACWVADFDRALSTAHRPLKFRAELSRLSDDDLASRHEASKAYSDSLGAEIGRRALAREDALVSSS